MNRKDNIIIGAVGIASIPSDVSEMPPFSVSADNPFMKPKKSKIDWENEDKVWKEYAAATYLFNSGIKNAFMNPYALKIHSK